MALTKVWDNPGADGRFWKLPFQTTAQWTTTGADVNTLRNGGRGTVNLAGNFSIPFYKGKATDPLVTVTTPGVHSITVHLPLGAIIEGPAASTDSSIGGADETKPGMIWSISGATMNTNGVQASGTIITGTYGLQVDWGFGPFMEDAVTGQPGWGNSYGIIQDDELSAALADPNYVIPHMITMQLDFDKQASAQGPVWPLRIIEVNITGNGTLPQGQTYGIPASTPRPIGQTRGFYLIWDVLQQFGMFMYNGGSFGGSCNIVIYSTAPSNATLVSQAVTAFNTQIMNSVCILANQTGPTSAKGMINGVRSDAFPAPPLLDLSDIGGVETSSSTVGGYWPTTTVGFSLASGGFTNPPPSPTSPPVTPPPTPPPPTPPPPTPPPTTTGLTFSDNFTTLSLHQTWQTGDNWQLISPDTPAGRGGKTFGELGDQWWTNPFNPNTLVSGLYTIDTTGLNLGLMATPASMQSYINTQSSNNLPYIGTLLNSSQTLYQKFGYFQITVSVPAVHGFSFQFCIENVQITSTWPPEIDLRIYTDSTGLQTVLFEVATSAANGGTWAQFTKTSAQGFDASIAHIYAWDWESDFITFYIDNVQVFQIPTPVNENYTINPMFMFLLTGANYIGNGDPSALSLPVFAHVNSVQVYASKPALTIPLPPTVTFSANQSLSLYDTTQPYKVWTFQPSSILLNGNPVTSITSGCIVNSVVGEVDDASGTMEDQLTGNFGYEAAAGTIRHWQLVAANGNSQFSIQNSLKFGLGGLYLNTPNTWNDYTTINPTSPYNLPYIAWPQTHADFGANTHYSGHVPIGATVGIPANVAMPVGLTPGGQLLWKNAQQFGWRWRTSDVGVNQGLTLYAEPRDENDQLIIGMRTDLPTIVNSLCVLINQTGPSSLKGGGVPLFQAPPALNIQGTSANNVITVNQPSGVITSTPFLMSGILTNYNTSLPLPVLTYADDGNIPQALTPGFSITYTGFNFLHPGLTVGAHTTIISDGVIQTPIQYTVSNPTPPPTPPPTTPPPTPPPPTPPPTPPPSGITFIVAPTGNVTSYTFPPNWNQLNNKIQAIGGGASGNSFFAGGGAAFAGIINFSALPSSNTVYSISPGNSNTYFGSPGILLAVGGNPPTANSGGIGGQASSCVGSTKFSGGNAPQSNSTFSGQGGPSAAGPFGAGTSGQLGGNLPAGGGGPGGGNAGGFIGLQPNNLGPGGVGGNNSIGFGGGTSGSLTPSFANQNGGNGINGAGGGGSLGTSEQGIFVPQGGSGGIGTEFDNFHGSGGGGGGTGGTGGPLSKPTGIISAGGTQFAEIGAIHLYPMSITQ